MTVSLIILSALAIVGAVLYVHHRLTSSTDSGSTEPALEASAADAADTDSACCGMHITCEKDSLLSAVSSEIVYYDDEELDSYRGREADGYDEEEIEQFRDVLLTLLPTDIAGWARSLQLRGITLPSPVREELLMIVAEERSHQTA